ncbi:MAG: hypothetical protein SPJ57_00890 [Candidatus Methanomethylophilaceae archaeon]|nr:hypothetical protein [Candidatus Methanomethylophilaceae archaeon]
MGSSMMKIVAIGIVAVVAAAGCAFVLVNNGDGNDGPITIVDGSGKELKFDSPIDKVVTANTNIPNAIKMLGYNDNIAGLSFYSSKTDLSNWNKFSPSFPEAKHMSLTKSMTAEEIAETGAEAVIVPVKSMTITPEQEVSFEEYGLTVIRLDCNGDSAIDDLRKLITLFKGNGGTNDNFDAYMELYNSIVNTVVSKAGSGSSDKTFLMYMSSGTSFYNQSSELSSIIESIYGKNALRNINNLDVSNKTNAADSDGLQENIRALDNSDNVDKLFIRGKSTTNSVDTAKTVWEESVFAKSEMSYGKLSPITAGEVYIFDSDIMSGLLTFVGYIVIAEVCGIDTGYTVSEVIDDFNNTFGYEESPEGLVFKVAGGNITDVTPA